VQTAKTFRSLYHNGVNAATFPQGFPQRWRKSVHADRWADLKRAISSRLSAAS